MFAYLISVLFRPEFSFQEHIHDSDTNVGKKQILKRNGSLEEVRKTTLFLLATFCDFLFPQIKEC